jgi:hypothetical protein
MITLLSMLCDLADGLRLESRVERNYHVLHDLTPAEARNLEGKRAGFRIALDSLEDDNLMIALRPVGYTPAYT